MPNKIRITIGEIKQLVREARTPAEAAPPPQLDIKKLVRLLKLPPGDIDSGSYYWSKRGGYAGKKTISNAWEAATALGWKPGKRTPLDSPDGSMMGSGRSLVSPDGATLEVDSMYGETKTSNRYTISLTLPKASVRESVNEAPQKYPGLTATERKQAKYDYWTQADGPRRIGIVLMSDFSGPMGDDTYNIYHVKDAETGKLVDVDDRVGGIKRRAPVQPSWIH